MQLIVQSSFFKALTFALSSSLWQMALMWLIVIFIFHIFKISAAQKFNIAFAAQLIGFGFFIYTLFNYNINTSATPWFKNNIFYINKLHVYISAAAPYVSIIYLLILIHQFLKLVFSYNITQRLKKYNLKKMPAANRIFIQQTTALLSFKKKVKVFLSSSIQCPLTIGFFKPVILVPVAAINHLTKEQMEAVLLHEMAHIKRYDYLFNLIQLFIEKIFFFNIFSKMINNIIEHERENACDDLVLQFRYNAFHYAEALLKMGRLQAMGNIAMAASGKKENVLLLRVKRLIHGGNHQNIHYNFKILAYCFFVLILALPILFFSVLHNNQRSSSSITNNATIIPAIKKQEILIRKSLLVQASAKLFENNLTAKSITKPLFKKDKIKPQVYTAVNNNIKNPVYFAEVKHSSDSLKQTAFINAFDKNIILNDDTYRKALSYQNFKQLEAMLQASGKSITITEDPSSKHSYKKLVTIEAADAQGNKNIYKVIVELYQ